LDFDTFYYEKLKSADASHYADENKNLIESSLQLKERFAAIWCYMAMTRAIDTLYIKIADLNSPFSSKLLDISAQLPYVQIIR